MGLSDDQKAMLRLLAQREEGYEDMAALMGISVEEVRERVKEALAEVEEPETPPEPASPQPPAPAAGGARADRHPRSQSPRLPRADSIARRQSPGASHSAAKRSRQALFPASSCPRTAAPWSASAPARWCVIALAIVLIVDGGGGELGQLGHAANQGETNAHRRRKRNLTQAVLAPTGDGDASGRALFGRYKKTSCSRSRPKGWSPRRQGQSYTVWLYRSPKLALQVGAVRVEDSGEIAAQFQIPAQLLAYVANGAFDQVDVSLTSIRRATKRRFAKAKRENKRAALHRRKRAPRRDHRPRDPAAAIS